MLLDSDGLVRDTYGWKDNGTIAYPFNVVIARDGTVAAIYEEIDPGGLIDEIEAVLY